MNLIKKNFIKYKKLLSVKINKKKKKKPFLLFIYQLSIKKSDCQRQQVKNFFKNFAIFLNFCLIIKR